MKQVILQQIPLHGPLYLYPKEWYPSAQELSKKNYTHQKEREKYCIKTALELKFTSKDPDYKHRDFIWMEKTIIAIFQHFEIEKKESSSMKLKSLLTFIFSSNHVDADSRIPGTNC